jgi:hypothetical protein
MVLERPPSPPLKDRATPAVVAATARVAEAPSPWHSLIVCCRAAVCGAAPAQAAGSGATAPQAAKV